VRQSTGRHRRTRTLSSAATVAVAAGAGGVCLGLSNGGAQAATTTVTVSSTAQLESAAKNAAAGTVIQVRGGTYYPTATLKSTASGTGSQRITLQAYGGEKVRIDGSKLPAGSWLAGIYGSYWTVQNLTFQNSPAQGLVVTSSTGGVFRNLVTADNGDSGFTLRGDNTVGFYFATGKAHLARNLAVSDKGGPDKLGPATVSAANNWDGGVSTPAFRSTDATTAYGARKPDGSLPATTFLATGSTAIGSPMN
jgi:hypothetical protein